MVPERRSLAPGPPPGPKLATVEPTWVNTAVTSGWARITRVTAWVAASMSASVAPGGPWTLT